MSEPGKKALLLVHRIPYPPDKGDKIRSWQLFRFLAERFNLSLGCFVDDQEDMKHAAHLRNFCSDVKAVPLNPLFARLKSLRGLVSGQPLTIPYYASGEMVKWVRAKRDEGLNLEVGFSSSMAQYLEGASVPIIMDLCDADSAKWLQFSGQKFFPMSWVYGREGRLLADKEAHISRIADATFFITEEEAALVKAHENARSENIDWYMNGVDTEYFSPIADFDQLELQLDLVFTGAMDYPPNVDAVVWFVENVWPVLQKKQDNLTFAIVGARPTERVAALAELPGITVTGRVDDIRPWLKAARVSVAPLQIARGIQNKVLEAMAMATPVVASSGAAVGLSAEPGRHFETVDAATKMSEIILKLLSSPETATALGAAGRQLVMENYRW